jgi:DNA-binding NarL/FixJ family response regulator
LSHWIFAASDYNGRIVADGGRDDGESQGARAQQGGSARGGGNCPTNVKDTKPNVFILSDLQLYREGLSSILVHESSLNVVGAAEPSDVTCALVEALAPDAIILDIRIPGSLEHARALRLRLPHTKMVAFAVANVDCEFVTGAMAGICGYVQRDGTVDDLVKVVLDAISGELHCSPRHSALLLEQVASLSRGHSLRRTDDSASHAPRTLTRRESEIFDLVRKGLSNKEIARTLNISCATVKNHVHHILEKSRVRRRSEVSVKTQVVTIAVAPDEMHRAIGGDNLSEVLTRSTSEIPNRSSAEFPNLRPRLPSLGCRSKDLFDLGLDQARSGSQVAKLS